MKIFFLHREFITTHRWCVTPYFFMPKFKKWRLMMSGEVKILKFVEDKPKDCKFCYYWGGKKKGCILGGEEKMFLPYQRTATC